MWKLLQHNKIDTIESFMTKEVYKINDSFNCDSKCLIYLFSRKICGIQYVGSTVDRFQLRQNKYQSCQKNAADGEHPTKTISINIFRWRS